jgi:hypothetical protein
VCGAVGAGDSRAGCRRAGWLCDARRHAFDALAVGIAFHALAVGIANASVSS